MQSVQGKNPTCFVCFGTSNLSNFAVVKSLRMSGGWLVDNNTFFFWKQLLSRFFVFNSIWIAMGFFQINILVRILGFVKCNVIVISILNFLCLAVDVFPQSTILLTLIWVGFLGIRFEVGGGGLTGPLPCLNLLRIMLATLN